MIYVNEMAAQGDVLFRRVTSIPSDARRQRRQGSIVVAHSETGHHHVIQAEGVTLFTTPDPLLAYLQIDAPFADVVHQRPFHTHETLRLLGAHDKTTSFEVRRQREHILVRAPAVEDAGTPGRPRQPTLVNDLREDLWRLAAD